MSSAINSSIPPFGNPTTAGIRSNFSAAKTEIEQLQNRSGFVDYSDSATATTPLNVLANTWTKLTNNTLGPHTVTSGLPSGVTSLWNTSTNQLVLSQLPVNSLVTVRKDIQVTTTAANQIVKLRTRFAVGDPIEFTIESSPFYFKNAGAQKLSDYILFYVGSEAVRTTPSEFQIWSDSACTVIVNGWLIAIQKSL